MTPAELWSLASEALVTSRAATDRDASGTASASTSRADRGGAAAAASRPRSSSTSTGSSTNKGGAGARPAAATKSASSSPTRRTAIKKRPAVKRLSKDLMLLSVLLKCVENGHFTTDQVIHWVLEARSGSKTPPKPTGHALFKRERQQQAAMRALSVRERTKRMHDEWQSLSDGARQDYARRAKDAEMHAHLDSESESDLEITDDEDEPPPPPAHAAPATEPPPSPPSDSD